MLRDSIPELRDAPPARDNSRNWRPANRIRCTQDGSRCNNLNRRRLIAVSRCTLPRRRSRARAGDWRRRVVHCARRITTRQGHQRGGAVERLADSREQLSPV